MYFIFPLFLQNDTAEMESPAPYSNPSLYNDYYTFNYKVPADLVQILSLDKSNVNNTIKPLTGNP